MAQEVKRQRGSFRKDPQRENKQAPPLDGNAPGMPEWFNDYEREKWNELSRDLDAMGVISSECREIMVAYCTAYAGWMKARAAIEVTGMVLQQKDKDGNDRLMRNPYSVELHKYRDEMNKLLPEFGLTPSSRGKLQSMKSPEEANPIAELLERFQSVN